MADVVQPPITVESEKLREKVEAQGGSESLVDALDELLKRYLLLLDEYTQARQQLSSDLSSGFISLAQANFNATNRVRYGQDFYDERMQALRHVAIEEKESKLRRSISLVELSAAPAEEELKAAGSMKREDTGSRSENPTSSSKSTESPDKNAGSQDESSEGISASVEQLDLSSKDDQKDASAGSEAKPDKTKGNAEKKSGKPKKNNDPIRWFGLFVPPALRNAQSSFTRAVEGPIPRIVDLAAELRELEIEIGRARKAIRKSQV